MSIRSGTYWREWYHWPDRRVVSMLTFVVAPEVGGGDHRDHHQPWHQAVLDQSSPPPTWRIISILSSFIGIITIFGICVIGDKLLCSNNSWEFVWKNVAELSLLSVELISLVPVLRLRQVLMSGLPPWVDHPQLGLHLTNLEAVGGGQGGFCIVQGHVQLEQSIRNLQQVRFDLLKQNKYFKLFLCKDFSNVG